MRLIFKILGILLIIVAIVVTGGLIYLFTAFPKQEEPPDVRIEITPERLVRGEYLARNVTVCLHCHADRKMEYFAMPEIRGTEGQGGLFIKQEGLGELYSPNITPHALGSWTDGEVIRAVTAGVNKDCDPLFPIMPYKVYADLKREDLYSIIAYIRTLNPIAREIPRTKLDFPLNLIVRMIPGPPSADPKVQSDPGHYLTTIAGCIACHTPLDDRGRPVAGMELAGGQKFGPNVQSANITPDKETGIGSWSKEEFLVAFQKWQDPAMQQIVMPEGRNTVMPWISYSSMKPVDLGLIYDYLRTVPAKRNRINKFPMPVK